MPVDDLAQLYRDVITDLLNRHYPVATIRRRVRPMTHAWFDAKRRAARHTEPFRAFQRRFRRLQRRSGAEVGLEVEAEGCCMNTRNTSIETRSSAIAGRPCDAKACQRLLIYGRGNDKID